MHSFKTGNTVFLHNGDFSGNVRIQTFVDEKLDKESTLPYKDMKALVAQEVRQQKISKIENAEDDEILNLP